MKILVISLVIIAVIITLVLLIFRKELLTLGTLKKVCDHPYYELDYRSDYKLDKFLKKGASTDEQLKTAVIRILLKGLPLSVNVKVQPEGACSTFAADTPNGDHLFGRNFDFKPSVNLLMRTAPKNGYRSIALCDLNHIGYSAEKLPDSSFANKVSVLAAPYMCLDGINEKGFAVGVLTAKEQITHQSEGRVPIMTTAAIRLLLDKAATVEEAIRLLSSYDMNSSGKTGYHFQLADSTGATAVVEYLNNKMVVIRRTKDEPYLAATNFTLSTPEKNGTGQERYDIVMDAIRRTGAVLTEEETMDVLQAAYLDGSKVYPDPNHMYHRSRTQWSAVYNLSQRTVSLCVGDNYGLTDKSRQQLEKPHELWYN